MHTKRTYSLKYLIWVISTENGRPAISNLARGAGKESRGAGQAGRAMSVRCVTVVWGQQGRVERAAHEVTDSEVQHITAATSVRFFCAFIVIEDLFVLWFKLFHTH